MNEKIIVLIPSLNPEKEFINYIKNLIKAYPNMDIIIVNDGSSNEKDAIFKEISKIKNTKVLTHETNKGKGEALKTGFKYFLDNYKKGSLVTADSDGQHSIEDIINIGISLINEKEKTLVIGTRDFTLKEVPFRSKLGNNITSFIFEKRFKRHITDTQSGLRGLTYDFIKDIINLNGSHFEYEINILKEAVKQKINIKEIKIKTLYFNNNKTSNYKTIKDSIKICKEIFRK